MKDDQVGEADGDVDGVEVLVVGAHRLDPAHGGGEVAAPGVDEQRSNGGLTSSMRRSAEPTREPVASSPASISSTRLTRVETSQSASRAIVWPTAAGEVDGHVEVDRAGVDDAHQGRDGLDVGGVKAFSPTVSGKPRARHSRRVWSMVTPVSAATSRALNSAPLRTEESSTLDAVAGRTSPASDSVRCHRRRAGRRPRAVELLGDLQLHLLHARDVVEHDAAVGAGVGDDRACRSRRSGRSRRSRSRRR